MSRSGKTLRTPPPTPTPPPQKKCADESLESLEISICCCCIGICWDCRPIIDDLEKAPIKIPQTPSIADVSMSIGNINLVSVVNLMACTHCSLTGNLHVSILMVLLSSENRIISSKNLFCRIFHSSLCCSKVCMGNAVLKRKVQFSQIQRCKFPKSLFLSKTAQTMENVL